jgi:mycobactin phenyloxazoline synthetase
MGAVVAFEFACVAERLNVEVAQLWASAGQAPSTVAESPALPTSDEDVLADMMDLGGTDPRLLDDEDFVELLVRAVQADYRAMDRYSCSADVRIAADIHAVAGERDHRVAREQMQRWETHTRGQFALSLFDGGHFYLTDHLDTVAALVSTDGR